MNKNKQIFRLFSILLVVAMLLSTIGCIPSEDTGSNKTQVEYYYIKKSDYVKPSNNNYNNNNNNNNNNDNNNSNDFEEIPEEDTEQDINGDDTLVETPEDEDPLPGMDIDDVVKVPETEIYAENFEEIGEEGAKIEDYYPLEIGDNVEAYVAKGAIQGEYCAEFKRTQGKNDWNAAVIDFDDFQNWHKQKYVSFWAKGDGQHQGMAFGFNDGSSKNQQYPVFDVSNEWTFYSFELQTEDVLMTNIKYFYFTWTGGNASVYVDDIRVTEEEVKGYNKYIPNSDAYIIENAENYNGDANGVAAAYTASEGSGTALATEKHTGHYSVKFTAKNEATIAAPLAVAKNLTNFNEISIWLKGDGAGEQTVKVVLLDGNNEVCSKDITVTDDWKETVIQFELPAGKVIQPFNAIKLVTNGGAEGRSFYLDDFKLQMRDGIVATPADVIENGEYYNATYTTDKAYITTAGTVVSVDSAVKKAGNNSVKFAVPAKAGDTTTAVADYVFQPKKVMANQAIRLFVKGDSAAGSQGIKVEVFTGTGASISTVNATINTTGDTWNEISIPYLTYSGAYVVSAKVTFNLSSAAANIWVDDFCVYTPEEKKIPAGYVDDYETYDDYFRLKDRVRYEHSDDGYDKKMTVSISDEEVLSGNYSLKMDNKGFHDGKWYSTAYIDMTGKGAVVKPGEDISYWVKEVGGNNNALWIEVITTAGKISHSECRTRPGEWMKVRMTNKLTGPGEVTQITIFSGNYGSTGDCFLYIDDIMINDTRIPEYEIDKHPNDMDMFESYTDTNNLNAGITIDKESEGVDTTAKVSLAENITHEGSKSLMVKSTGFIATKRVKTVFTQAYEVVDPAKTKLINKGDKLSFWVYQDETKNDEMEIVFKTVDGATYSSGVTATKVDEWVNITITYTGDEQAKISEIIYTIHNKNTKRNTTYIDDITIVRAP